MQPHWTFWPFLVAIIIAAPFAFRWVANRTWKDHQEGRCGCPDHIADDGKMIPEARNDHFAGDGNMVNDVQQDDDLDLSARAAGATGIRQKEDQWISN